MEKISRSIRHKRLTNRQKKRPAHAGFFTPKQNQSKQLQQDFEDRCIMEMADYYGY